MSYADEENGKREDARLVRQALGWSWKLTKDNRSQLLFVLPSRETDHLGTYEEHPLNG